MESSFTRLDAMDSSIDEEMQVALLLVSVSSIKDFQASIAAIKTMKQTETTWNYVSSRLIEEGSGFGINSSNLSDANNDYNKSLVAAAPSSDKLCSRCNLPDHTAYDYRTPWERILERRKQKRNNNDDSKINDKAEPARLAAMKLKSPSILSNEIMTIDSGASKHIYFISLQTVSPMVLEVAEGRKFTARQKHHRNSTATPTLNGLTPLV